MFPHSLPRRNCHFDFELPRKLKFSPKKNSCLPLEPTYSLVRLAWAILEAFTLRDGIIGGINTFTQKFDKVVTESHHGNLIYSPLNIWMTLMMFSNVSSGTTKKELLQALNTTILYSGKNNPREALKQITNDIPKEYINVTYKYFVDDRKTMKDSFKNYLELNFQQFTSHSVTFTQRDVAVERINYWVNQWYNRQSVSTSKKVIEISDVEKNRGIILVNAMNIRSFWREGFELNSLIADCSFNLQNGTIKNTTMMGKLDYFETGRITNLQARFIVLPWKEIKNTTNIRMVLILPDRGINISYIEDGIRERKLQDTLEDNRQSVLLWFKIPKFRFESTIDLTDSLKTFGVKEMFTKNASFDGFIDAKKIGRIFQKVVIEMNEQGLLHENNDFRKFVGSSIKDFIVDRPFLLYILTPKTTLLKARIVDPTQE